MNRGDEGILSGYILESRSRLTVDELCQACEVRTESIVELVEHGILEPKGRRISEWSFANTSFKRARVALRLQRDLGVNCAGAGIILDLLEELERTRRG